MRERQQTALFLKQIMNEVQGMRSNAVLEANLQRNGVAASVVASLAGQSLNDLPSSNLPPKIEVEPIAIPLVIPVVENELNADIDDGNDESGESSYLENTEDEPEPESESKAVEAEKAKRVKKSDAKTQLIDWMLQQSQSDDEDRWYIHRIMKNTLPLADILYEMPEDINVGRAAMIKLFSSIRSGDFNQVLEEGISRYGLPRTKVFVTQRASINAAPPAAKRGRKNKG